LAPFAEFVDMESFGVLSAAQKCGRPAVAIRVISDSDDKELPMDLDMTVNEKGRYVSAEFCFIWEGIRCRLPALFRLGRDSRIAALSLANFLEAYIKKLSLFTHGWFPDGEGLEEVAAR